MGLLVPPPCFLLALLDGMRARASVSVRTAEPTRGEAFTRPTSACTLPPPDAAPP